MKKLILLSVLVTNLSFAENQSLLCTKLLNGNFNGEADIISKGIDVEIFFNTVNRTAALHGQITIDKSRYYNEGEVLPINNYFLGKTSVTKDNNIITFNSKDSGMLLCSRSVGPCQEWARLEYNEKTGHTLFEYSYSYSRMPWGKRYFENSIMMKCEKN